MEETQTTPFPRKVKNGIRRAWKFVKDRLGLLTAWLKHCMRLAKDHSGLLILLLNVIVLVGFIAILIWDWWGWWGWLSDDEESDSTTVRNLGLFVAAIIGLLLAIWRSVVADRQSKTAQRSLLNERYQKGADMLGSKVLSVRVGGVYALERLAKEHAEDYHIPITVLFCAFVRNPPKDENAKDKNNNNAQSDTPQEEKHSKIRADVQAIMTALGRRNKKQRKIENQKTSKEPILNLTGANLFGMGLAGANVSGARFDHAKLYSAVLDGADLSSARLDGADLSSARLKGVRGLTQAQLDQAVAYPKNPPNLEGAKDSETGEPLVWRGKAPPPIIVTIPKADDTISFF